MKKTVKRKHTALEEVAEKSPEPLPAVRNSDEPVQKKRKWTNKQRVLVFASRGINHRDRHLMEDIKKMMPHHKPESKMERSKTLSVVNELCEMKNCNKAIMFEGRKKQDLYMWLSNVPNGPSAKFLVENVSTMAELKLTGNCLRGSRPLLSFDKNFQNEPQYSLLKELLTQIFGVPKHHPKSQPFFDHVYTFTILDHRIWFRNFQILSEDGAVAEIGPRFVLNPVKIFSGSFSGQALWENPHYLSPARYRHQVRLQAKNKYLDRVQQKTNAEINKPDGSTKPKIPLEDIFKGDPVEKAEELNKEQELEKTKEKKMAKKKKVLKRGGTKVLVSKAKKVKK